MIMSCSSSASDGPVTATHLMSPRQNTPFAGMNTSLEWSQPLACVMPPILSVTVTVSRGTDNNLKLTARGNHDRTRNLNVQATVTVQLEPQLEVQVPSLSGFNLKLLQAHRQPEPLTGRSQDCTRCRETLTSRKRLGEPPRCLPVPPPSAQFKHHHDV